jgi:hypothetical protein
MLNQAPKIKIVFVFLVCIFGFLFFILSFPQEGLAQGTGIKVSPLRIEELVDPGETIEKRIKVTNVSDSPATFYIYLMDFKAKGEGGQALLIPAGAEEGPF